MYRAAWLSAQALVAAATVCIVSGCTHPREYVRNGFKVGPDLGVPEGCVASRWIDEADVRVQ